MSAPLSCIACGKKLECVFPEPDDDDFAVQPYRATMFTSHGNYGSTVFEPSDGTFLEINVCDDCLTAAAGQGRVTHATPVRFPPESTRAPWDGKESL